MDRPEVFDTGFTVVYEPADPHPGSPLVDIVFIHGLQGHPYRTWTYPTPPSKSNHTSSGPSSAAPASHTHRSFRKKLLNLATLLKQTDRRKARARSPLPETESGPEKPDRVGRSATVVFWPADLLSKLCPRARILVWGYDTKVAKMPGEAVSKSNVFTEGKNLLFAFGRERDLDVPTIFVAHSLGGVVLKEALTSSYHSGETDLENIAKSIKAVIFMGTPHRGSKDMAGVGDIARRVASAFLADTNSAMLDSIGLKNSDLERCQDSFTRIWQNTNMKIKTFQEGLPYAGVSLGLLNEKIVPDYSSLLGDPREHAETLQANHMEMCRFQGEQDPNYRKVGAELRSMYKSIIQTCCTPTVKPQPPSEGYRLSDLEKDREALNQKYRDVRSQLYFPELGMRQHAIETAFKDTCQLLLKSEKYEMWYNRQDLDKHQGLLWIKGKPGSGKSTLMKEAAKEAQAGRASHKQHIVSFFFNAHGNDLEKTSTGFFRALTYQLLPIFWGRIREFVELCSTKTTNDDEPAWDPKGLKNSIRALFAEPSGMQIFVFVDALDECVDDGPRDIIHFLRELSADACSAGVELNVCISSRHYPTITVAGYLELVLEDYNSSDIAHFVDRKLSMAISEGPFPFIRHWDNIKNEIIQRASGIFLWAKLVLDVLLADYDKGKSIKFLESRLNSVPQALEDLYTQILQSVKPDELSKTARFFSWVLLAIRPIQLHEWYQLLAFIDDDPPRSLTAWKNSNDAIDHDDQLQKRIRQLSKGLVEVQKFEVQENGTNDERDSIRAAPGSLGGEGSGTLQFIHESVREFFLKSSGVKVLYPTIAVGALDEAHLSILKTCFDYLAIEELDELVNGRMNASPSISRTASTSPSAKSKFEGPRHSGSERARDLLSRGMQKFKIVNRFIQSEDASARPGEDVLDLRDRIERLRASLYEQSRRQPTKAGMRIPLRREGSISSRISYSSRSTVGSSASNYTHLTHSIEDDSDLRTSSSIASLVSRIDGRPIPPPLLPPSLAPLSVFNDLDRNTQGLSNEQDARYSIVSVSLSELETNAPATKDTSDIDMDSSLQKAPNLEMNPSPIEESSNTTAKSDLLRQFLAQSSEACSVPEEIPHMASVSQSSSQSRRHILTEIPCLLYYASEAIIPHATAAEREGCDPAKLIDSLRPGKSWSRWVSLRDDMSHDTSLLYFAADQGLFSWVEQLLLTDTDINVRNGKLGHPLLAAAHKGHEKIIHHLLQSGANINTPDQIFQTTLHYLAAASNSTLLRQILCQQDHLGSICDIEAADIVDRKPLHVAAEMADKGTVEELVKHGANVNSLDARDDTPLHYAVFRTKEDPDIVEYLLQSGANVQQRNLSEETPLDTAVRRGFVTSVGLMQGHIEGRNSQSAEKGNLSTEPAQAENGNWVE